MEKKRISWISVTYFVDTDLPSIKHLQLYYDIRLILVIPWYEKNDYRKYISEGLGSSSKVDVHFVYQKSRWTSYSHNFMNELLKLANEYDPAMYYISYQGSLGGASFYRKHLDLSKVIVPCHNVSTPKGARMAFLAKIQTKKWIDTFCNIQVFSDSQKQKLASITSGKNILATPFFLKDYGNPSTSIDKHSSGSIIFLSFGNIVEYKRIDLLIKAANKVYDDGYRNFKIKIAGHCKNWDSYQTLITHPEVFELIIKRIPNEDIPNLFASCHYFVLPYQDIAQSGSITVAYCYGLPAITSDIPQFSEFVKDGVTGYQFKTEDYLSLAKVMERILDEPIEQYHKMCESLQRFIHMKFSDEAIVGDTKEYFDKIIGE